MTVASRFTEEQLRSSKDISTSTSMQAPDVASILGQIYKKLESLEPTMVARPWQTTDDRSARFEQAVAREVENLKSPEDCSARKGKPQAGSHGRFQVQQETEEGSKEGKSGHNVNRLDLRMVGSDKFKLHTASISSSGDGESDDEQIVTFRDNEENHSVTTSVALGRKPFKEIQTQKYTVECGCRTYLESRFDVKYYEKYIAIVIDVHKCALQYMTVLGIIFKRFNYTSEIIADSARKHLMELKERYTQALKMKKMGYNESALDNIARLASETVFDTGMFLSSFRYLLESV